MKKMAFILFVCFTSMCSNGFAQGTEICQNPEIEAEYFGGADALMAYIQKTLVYPKKAVKNGDEGRVVVRFVIEKNGEVTQLEIEQGATQELEDEAMRVLSAMSNWKPAICNGASAASVQQLPMVFTLNTKRKKTKASKRL